MIRDRQRRMLPARSGIDQLLGGNGSVQSGRKGVGVQLDPLLGASVANTLLFRPGEDRPAALSRRVGDTDYLTATVEEYRPTD